MGGSIQFIAAGRTWSIRAADVAGIRLAAGATRVPRSAAMPDYVLGVIVDSEVARSVIDFGLLAGSAPAEPGVRSRLVCLSGDGPANIALLVDRVLDPSESQEPVAREGGPDLPACAAAPAEAQDAEGNDILITDAATILGALFAVGRLKAR